MRSALGLLVLLAGGSPAMAADPDPTQLKGKWELWEDHEGGTVCPITLESGQAIGGFALTGSEACFRKLKLRGDPYAWFLDKDGNFILIDATRKMLARFDRLEDGTFYARRGGEGLDNLNLTPKR